MFRRTALSTALTWALLALPAAAETETGPPGTLPEASPTHLLRVTEVAPSGTAFESLSNSDVIGLHSRIQVWPELSIDDLKARIERLEATASGPLATGDLAASVAKLSAGLDALRAEVTGVLGHPERPVPTDLAAVVDRAIAPDGQPGLTPLLAALSRSLRERGPTANTYRLHIRARLQPHTPAGGLPWPGRPGPEVAAGTLLTLTPDAAPPVWVSYSAHPLPPLLDAELSGLLGVGTEAPWAAAVKRLDAESAKSHGARHAALAGLRADVTDVVGRLKSVADLLSLTSEVDGPEPEPGYVPELATLDLDRVPGRRPGQHVVFQLALSRNGRDVALLDERSLIMHRVGLYADLKAGVNAIPNPLYDPTGADPRRSAPFAGAFALTVLAKWGYRTGFTDPNLPIFGDQVRLRGLMGGGAVMWNEIWDPGIGLNLCSPGLAGTGAFEPGVGVGLTFFRDLVQVGRGYDFATGQFYWYGGLGVPWSLGDLLGG